MRYGVLLLTVLGLGADSVVWRLPAGPRVARIGRTRTWVVRMAPATPTGQVGFQGRVVVLQRMPANSAAPCFLPGASPEWVS